MKKTSIAVALAVALAASLAAQSAFARHHKHGGPRVSIGFSFGIPLGAYPLGAYPLGAYPYGAYPYYYPAYYYPPYYVAPVVVQQQPTVYIEQQPAPAAQPSAPAGYWYYCADSRGYYPYVKECPSGWQRVAPQP